MGFPAGGQGIAFGAFCPSGSAFLVEALAAQRIRDLDLLSSDPELSPETRGLISGRRFHTYADFCLELKSQRPGKNDVIGYGDSLRRGEADLTGYLAYLRERDPQFAAFLEKPQGAVIDREFFDTSVYITGETKSGKSYLAETLAFLLAREPQAGVWVLDPHGALARSCATWQENRGRPALYFDVNLARGRFPRFNPFDQLPDRETATLDTVTQEQVNAFAVIAGASAMTDNMRNLLASAIYLMLTLPSGSMQELFRLMDDSRNADLVRAGEDLSNPFHREYFRYEFRKKTLAATKHAISTRLGGLLSSSALYAITSGPSTFQIPELFNRAGVYIFNLGKGVLGENAATMLGRLILAQLQAAAFKRERDGLTEKNVPTYNYCLIDECHNFVNQATGTIAAETRKYGLSLILVQQFAGQGIEAKLFENFLTNTPLKFTGVGTAGTYRQVAECQQVESFLGLKPRRFHVSKRGSLPFIATASPALAGREARMSPEEWREFTAGQLVRFYPAAPRRGTEAERGAAVGGAVLVAGADPEEYAHERALAALAGAAPPSPAVAGVAGLLGSIRRKLTGQAAPPAAPVPPPSSPPAPPRTPRSPPLPPAPPEPEAADYEPEAEIEPGVFYSRKKPRFPRP